MEFPCRQNTMPSRYTWLFIYIFRSAIYGGAIEDSFHTYFERGYLRPPHPPLPPLPSAHPHSACRRKLSCPPGNQLRLSDWGSWEEARREGIPKGGDGNREVDQARRSDQRKQSRQIEQSCIKIVSLPLRHEHRWRSSCATAHAFMTTGGVEQGDVWIAAHLSRQQLLCSIRSSQRFYRPTDRSTAFLEKNSTRNHRS